MPENRNELGQYVKGVSGNPGGRPAGISLTNTILRMLTEAEAESVVQAAIDAAKAGDMRAFRELIERTDGKVTDKIEHTGNVTTEITVNQTEPRKPKVE